MYQQVETEKQIVMVNGGVMHPVATLHDEFGGKFQILMDDGCYILALMQDDGKYKVTSYIFGEVFDVLTTLDRPSKELAWELSTQMKSE